MYIAYYIATMKIFEKQLYLDKPLFRLFLYSLQIGNLVNNFVHVV